MFRYAITSRTLYAGNEPQRQTALVRETSRWAADGVDMIQLREKDLPDHDIASLAHEILEAIAAAGSLTKLLINSRVDVAVGVGAHGVHLTARHGEITPAEVRSLYASAGRGTGIVTVSCHTLDEVTHARNGGADGILFAPVFEKVVEGVIVRPAQGLERLRAACLAAAPTPVYALGGVTLQNAGSCLDAGAAGIAGIRLFHNG
jgi:thiamine-phosphate pyrophosphorylase